MAIVVVGGSSRNVGKTSVVAGLIAAMPQMRWTAFKVTPHWHGELSDNATLNDGAVMYEEHNPNAGTDSARFLASGAVRSLLVRARSGDLAVAMPLLRKELERAENAIFESNSILRFLQPDLYLSVLGLQLVDFKESARLFLERADALLVPEELLRSVEWKGVSLKLAEGTPVLPMRPPVYVTDEVKSFVAGRLSR